MIRIIRSELISARVGDMVETEVLHQLGELLGLQSLVVFFFLIGDEGGKVGSTDQART